MMESRAGIKVKFYGPTNYRGQHLVASREKWGEDIPAQSIKVSWEYGLDPAANVEAAANAFLDRFVNVDGSRGARAKIAVAFDGDYYVSWGWVDDAGEWL